MGKIVEKLQADKDLLIAGKGVSADLIAKAESELQVEFAADYKDCLLSFGVFGYDGHEIMGITDNARWDVVGVTKQQRLLNPDVPADWYVIEVANIDGIVIWQDAKGTVFGTAPGCEAKRLAGNIEEYLST